MKLFKIGDKVIYNPDIINLKPPNQRPNDWGVVIGIDNKYIIIKKKYDPYFKVLNNYNSISHFNPDQILPIINEYGESLDIFGNILPNCPICWDVINGNNSKTYTKLLCGGFFHTNCITTMTNCPVCSELI